MRVISLPYLAYFSAAIDDCSSNPCNNGGSCSDLQDDISCQCQPGYSGKFCENENDECLSDPCYQGATCVDKVITPQTGHIC